MITKPKGIYLVVIWFWLSLTMQEKPIFDLLKSSPGSISGFEQLIVLFFLLFLIFMTVNLLRVKMGAVNTAVIFFMIVAIFPIIKILFGSLKIPPMRITILLLIIEIFNIISLWYLLTPNNRKIFKEYRKERDIEILNKKLLKNR